MMLPQLPLLGLVLMLQPAAQLLPSAQCGTGVGGEDRDGQQASPD